MEWVLWWVLVIGFAAVLFVPYRRAGEGNESGGTPADESPRDRTETGPPLLAHGIAVYAHEDGTVPASEPGRCRSCGTDNDASYTYCRECLTPLF